MTTKLTVQTQQHNYPIVILEDSEVGAFDFDLSPYIRAKQVLVITNERVAPLYLDALCARLLDYDVATCVLADGEAHKTQASIDLIYDVLMQAHFSRDCTVIALGGGVIGDMAGFAAASFMRGVNFIQIPTTLLAQVDSSVGGKTGINHPLGKNMIGAFWQPSCVLIELATLHSLPKREFSAGMAEVIKYALIMDESFLDWLCDNHLDIKTKQPTVLSEMIRRSCQYKADIVAQDEKESGVRAWLNFGHTFGHVIETYMGYGNWLHGEAVAAGMVQAAKLSCLMGLIDEVAVARVVHVLTLFDLPVVAPKIPEATALDLMGHDKKVKDGKLRFILLRRIGEAMISSQVEISVLKQVLSVKE